MLASVSWLRALCPVDGDPERIAAALTARGLTVDAVSTAVMGFDPTATRSESPFLRSDNHLNIAAELGLGTNRLDRIEVVGVPIGDVRYEFQPA